MIFAKGAALFLLLVLAMAGLQARAQNQTPANVPPVGWTDTASGLTWTKQDNGSDVNWNQATDFCSNLRLGGYSDWRLPTIDELQDIYDANAGDKHVKGNLKLSASYQWSSSQASSPGKAWYFFFGGGNRFLYRISDSRSDRALCVRR
jgi:opacity protein-like surface antigen